MPNWKPFAIGLMVVVIAAAIGSAGVSWSANAQEGTGGTGGTGPGATEVPPTLSPPPPTETPVPVPPTASPTDIVPTVVVPTETPVPTPDPVLAMIADVQAQLLMMQVEAGVNHDASMQKHVETRSRLTTVINMIGLLNENTGLEGWPTAAEWDVWLADWSDFMVAVTDGQQNQNELTATMFDELAAEIAALPTPGGTGSTIIEDCYKCFGP